MAKFVTKDRTPQRFPGDFQIDPVAGELPSDEETAFLAKAGATLDALASAVAAEDKETLREKLRLARRNWRSAMVSKLRGVADQFAGGQIAPNAASEQFAAIEAAALAKKPDVIVEIAKDDSARFQGDFKVTIVAYEPDEIEKAFFNRLERGVNFLADEEQKDLTLKLSDGVLAARRQLRATAADRLRDNVKLWKVGNDPRALENNVLMIRGRYEGLRDRLGRSLFAIKVVYDEGEEEETKPPKKEPAKSTEEEEKKPPKKDRRKYAVDLEIVVEKGLPAPEDTPSSEKQDLFVQLNNACAVIRTVCQQIRDGAETPASKTIKSKDDDAVRRAQRTLVDNEAINRARRLLDEYVRKLAGIGQVGLEGPHTALAKAALVSLKSEFVAHEGGRIKNRYLRQLGRSSAFFAVVFLFAYACIVWGADSCAVSSAANAPATCAAASWTWSGPAPHAPDGGCGNVVWTWSGPATHAPASPCAAASRGWWGIHISSAWWDAHKMFLLAAAGAAIGTWISFAIRRLDLPFEELTLLEEASLDPPFRILFVTGLTLIVCLLFWNGAVNIEIGNLKTGPAYFKTSGTIAILIGMFCGLSERALATAVSGRAATFVKGVGG